MAKNTTVTPSIHKATVAMVIFAVLGALVSGGSFEIIKIWPQPVSVAPYFGWQVGSVWGLVVGGVVGFILGYLTDDQHFKRDEPTQ